MTVRQRKLFLHIHIPKCGGTSFNEVLWRNFRLGFHMEYGQLNMLRPTADQVEYALSRSSWIRAIAGHRFHTQLKYHGRDHRIIAITFARTPVEHFTSTYNFMIRDRYPGIEGFGIGEFADWILGRSERPGMLSPWFAHSQLEHLHSERDLSHIKGLVEEGSLFVFPIERFADACLVLNSRFPEHFSKTAFRVKNISPRVQEPAPHVVDMLREYRQADFELHDFAHRFLDRELTDALNGDELRNAREQQQRRCRRLGSRWARRATLQGDLLT